MSVFFSIVILFPEKPANSIEESSEKSRYVLFLSISDTSVFGSANSSTSNSLLFFDSEIMLLVWVTFRRFGAQSVYFIEGRIPSIFNTHINGGFVFGRCLKGKIFLKEVLTLLKLWAR